MRVRIVSSLSVLFLGPAAFGLGCSGTKPCDSVALSGCSGGKSCELVEGGEPACFKPVVLKGRVFDLADQSPVTGARIVALDANGSPVSSVAVSGASGNYDLPVPTKRAADGAPVGQEITLRADAAGYQSFPSGLRVALPIDTASAEADNGGYKISNALTDIGLIGLPPGTGTGSIHGRVEIPPVKGGVLAVAESGSPPSGTSAVADRDGNYRIFNLAAGTYTVRGYAKGANYDTREAELSEDGDARVNLSLNDQAPATLNGSVQIVDAPGGSATSVTLIVESTFNESLVRGDAAPGLRAPPPGTPPNVTGAFTIEGIPAGRYVVLAAFENDSLVRDPDRCISGTAVLHQEFTAGQTVDVSSGFKITGALEVIRPGAAGAEPVTGAPVFSWVDDSSEDGYYLTVFDSFGNKVWEKLDVPKTTGGNPSVTYQGPALQSGMYYQYRAVSWRSKPGEQCEISQTEDLKGVFFVP